MQFEPAPVNLNIKFFLQPDQAASLRYEAERSDKVRVELKLKADRCILACSHIFSLLLGSKWPNQNGSNLCWQEPIHKEALGSTASDFLAKANYSCDSYTLLIDGYQE